MFACAVCIDIWENTFNFLHALESKKKITIGCHEVEGMCIYHEEDKSTFGVDFHPARSNSQQSVLTSM